MQSGTANPCLNRPRLIAATPRLCPAGALSCGLENAVAEETRCPGKFITPHRADEPTMAIHYGQRLASSILRSLQILCSAIAGIHASRSRPYDIPRRQYGGIKRGRNNPSNDVLCSQDTERAEHAVGFNGDEEFCRARFPHQLACIEHAPHAIDVRHLQNDDFPTGNVSPLKHNHWISIAELAGTIR